MKIYKLLFLLLFFLIVGKSAAQVTDYELGSSLFNRYSQQTGLFDLSDPNAVNIKVAVWGFVRYPGKYIVPSYTTISDLLSYAGGPTDAAELEELKLYRVHEDGRQELINVNFSEIMWNDKLDSKFNRAPNLEAGDILVVTGSPRLYTRDQVTLWVTILSALISLSILVLNIVRN